MAETIRELTVVIDEYHDECLYIDGEVWNNTGETTVFACELAEASQGEPCLLKHVSIDHSFKKWPRRLEDVAKVPAPETTEA